LDWGKKRAKDSAARAAKCQVGVRVASYVAARWLLVSRTVTRTAAAVCVTCNRPQYIQERNFFPLKIEPSRIARYRSACRVLLPALLHGSFSTSLTPLRIVLLALLCYSSAMHRPTSCAPANMSRFGSTVTAWATWKAATP
jgi:hypothetical protein